MPVRPCCTRQWPPRRPEIVESAVRALEMVSAVLVLAAGVLHTEPLNDDAATDTLVTSLQDVWARLRLPRAAGAFSGTEDPVIASSACGVRESYVPPGKALPGNVALAVVGPDAGQRREP